jgi:mannosyltransferase
MSIDHATSLSSGHLSLKSAGYVHGVGLVFVIFIAALLRFHDLDVASLWYGDGEGASWYQASLPLVEMIAATAQDNYPPLHNIILHVTMMLFGDGETTLRIPSALLGVVNVYLVYRLGSELWDRTTGLVAALLLTLSGFHVWYSTLVRMYALFAFTATLFVLTVVYATRRPSWLTLTGCAVAGTVLLYSHVYGSFVFAGVNLVVLTALVLRCDWLAVDWKRWVAAQVVPVVIFLPWALILWARAGEVMEGFWIPEPTARNLLRLGLHLTGGFLSFVMLGTLASLSVLKLRTLSPGAWRTTGAAAALSKTQSWLRSEWQIAILLGWLIAPISFGFVISIISQPILYDRYLICVLPALLLLAARGLTSLNFSTAITAIILGMVVLTSIPSLYYSTFIRSDNNDRRALVREFLIRYLPSDRIFFVQEPPPPALLYYLRKAPDLRICNKTSKISSTEFDVNRVWLVFSQGIDEAARKAISMAESTHSMTFSLRLSGQNIFLLFERHDGQPGGA